MCTIARATVVYQQIDKGNIANHIHGFTIDYGKFLLITHGCNSLKKRKEIHGQSNLAQLLQVPHDMLLLQLSGLGVLPSLYHLLFSCPITDPVWKGTGFHHGYRVGLLLR